MRGMVRDKDARRNIYTYGERGSEILEIEMSSGVCDELPRLSVRRRSVSRGKGLGGSEIRRAGISATNSLGK